MAQSTDRRDKRRGPNPNVNSHSGGINPSAPSNGTEGWGHTRDEPGVVSTNKPEATGAGQMKGNLSDDMTTASRSASNAAMTNKRHSEDVGNNQADLSRRSTASSDSMNTRRGVLTHTFRCADAGNADCPWHTSGKTEDEVMEQVVQHAKYDHGMTDWSDAMHDRVRHAIRHRQAA